LIVNAHWLIPGLIQNIWNPNVYLSARQLFSTISAMEVIADPVHQRHPNHHCYYHNRLSGHYQTGKKSALPSEISSVPKFKQLFFNNSYLIYQGNAFEIQTKHD
jgi:hypothetical protein